MLLHPLSPKTLVTVLGEKQLKFIPASSLDPPSNCPVLRRREFGADLAIARRAHLLRIQMGSDSKLQNRITEVGHAATAELRHPQKAADHQGEGRLQNQAAIRCATP